ncbi:MAG TPA: hypothetical protein VK209_01805 [Candidatus Sulfotelmatobacter sp.]|nr:hypothetical protein [Candidatus Sulfotelmatobacter sp.]
MDNLQEIELIIARPIKKDGPPASNTYKIKLCNCYANYYKFYKIYWERPEYYPEEHAIQPPSPEK